MDGREFPSPRVQDALTPPPGGLELATVRPATASLLAAADHAARHWADPEAGPVRLGSATHKRLACRMFFATFNPYKPSVIDWPVLSPAARERLVNLPIWDIAVHTEGKAQRRMLAYAHSLADPDWRGAIELNGWEEGRHKVVLANLVQAYGITLAPEPVYKTPRRAEWAYLATGFSECIDSFFAFGLFDLAKRSGFFPPELVDTFEPVIQEEARHILLFANWVAWRRRTMPLWRRPFFELEVVAAWVVLGWQRLDLARGMQGGKRTRAQDNNFTANGSKLVTGQDVGVAAMLKICLDENDRRFAGYDARLLRPATMPGVARLALRLLRRA